MTFFIKELNALIRPLGENRYLTLKFSLAKCFCSTYLKYWSYVEQGFGFTVHWQNNPYEDGGQLSEEEEVLS